MRRIIRHITTEFSGAVFASAGMTCYVANFEDTKMAEVITRKWKNGVCVEETREQIDWEPNEADLDTVDIECECGNKFDMPRDCLMFGFDGMYCGQCGESGKFRVAKAT